MKSLNLFMLLMAAILIAACGGKKVGDKPLTLKDAFADKFYVGTALSADQITGRDPEALNIVDSHFSAIVPENCMKSEVIQPQEGQFDFTVSDRFVEFGSSISSL